MNRLGGWEGCTLNMCIQVKMHYMSESTAEADCEARGSCFQEVDNIDTLLAV